MAEKHITIPTKPAPTPDGWVTQGTPPRAAKAAGRVKRLTLDLPADLHQRLKLQAVREERTILELAREVFEQYLQRNETRA